MLITNSTYTIRHVLNSNTVFPDMTVAEFRNVKDRLKQRFSLIKRPTTQQGTIEAFAIDSPEGKISFLYFEKGKLMIQSSPANSEYSSIVDEISKSFSKYSNKQNENDKLIPLIPTKKEPDFPKPSSKPKKLACFRCKEEIYFDPNIKSEKGKLIPLDPITNEPHDCPKSKFKKRKSFGQEILDLQERDREQIRRHHNIH